MALIGYTQREHLTRDVGTINKAGGSVSYNGAPMDNGAGVARVLEQGMASNRMTAEAVENIIARLQSIANAQRVFDECRANPLCQPKPTYTGCDVEIDETGFLTETWH